MMIKHLIFMAVLFIACFDFKFESEYEDINGIYLEYVTHYHLNAFKLLFQGDTGYIMEGTAISTYDFTNVDSLFLLNTYDFGQFINDFLIEDNLLFLALLGELRIIDISNPQPQLISALPIEYPLSLQKSGNLLYARTFDRLVITDITDAANPVELCSYELDGMVPHFEIDSGFVYIFSRYDLQILDMTDPTNPSLIYSLTFTDTMPLPNTFTKKGSFVYVAARNRISGAPMLITYAISTDHTLLETSRISCPHLINYFNTEHDHVLAVTGTCFYLLNLEYPPLPCISEVGYWGGIYGVINENYIYITLYDLVIFEIRQVEQ